MRTVTVHRRASDLRVTEEGAARFRAYADQEIEQALSARQPQEAVWRQALRQYEGVARAPVRNTPVVNAPNIEVTLGAIATDAVYAQGLDLIFNVSPWITARAIAGDRFPERIRRAKSLQTFVNSESATWGVREAAEETILDDVKLGTGVYRIPMTEDIIKTRVLTTVARGPKVLTLSVEDFLMPGGAYGDLQTSKWCAERQWMTQTELEDAAEAEGWDIEGVVAAGNVGWVRNRREVLGRSVTSAVYNTLFEIWRIYAYYDIDDDGIAEDLCGVWDRTSRKLLSVEYNRYDRRPYEAMRYQLRGHLFYGLGVMDMIAPYQEECTEIHNAAVLNAMLANARLWKAKDGSVPETMQIWPGKVQFMNNPDDLEALQLADIYPSIGALQSFPIAMAERRVGINDLSTPRPSAVLGSRTPGITALSLLQQTNRRFTPAFDAIRVATANAVKQCLFRIQESLLAGDRPLEKHIRAVLGDMDGEDVIGLLKQRNFDRQIEIELTANSATLNRDVERQNALLLINVLSGYYEKTLQLVAIAANPQTPPPVRDVAKKISMSVGELIDRTLRTFDTVRDPSSFIVDVESELDQIEQTNQQGLQGLLALVSGASQRNGGPPLEGLPGAIG